ncbi:BlaI/MecI/CopY family transcriptional regulator [Paenibacillus sp. EKM202P]|uniref:BlaI/MecI/CopY family transcriptional regulator n=1 Tax=unclassified Paenibacillus TaxID=185978 RepID=UPI0013EAD0DB|nr:MULTISPECIES: BlaI/MecI/CopY family transcriptional regulator [unclassified Paenibacillus]KAF6557425.1 BlaI/MecI/CopY family transcriptional regulator [Paenibacillus sp. EKM202P]KAF6562938.1 BlaI/MecI/CopY family transcriptional regulator [Paenibacillus sp. EKM207P]
MKKLPRISQKEQDVLLVFWRDGGNLTASAIADIGDGLSINTVQAAVRSLLKKEYIEIADIVYSGTVLTRSYKPVISAEEYAAYQLQILKINAKNFSVSNFVEHFKENNEIECLKELK